MLIKFPSLSLVLTSLKPLARSVLVVTCFTSTGRNIALCRAGRHTDLLISCCILRRVVGEPRREPWEGHIPTPTTTNSNAHHRPPRGPGQYNLLVHGRVRLRSTCITGTRHHVLCANQGGNRRVGHIQTDTIESTVHIQRAGRDIDFENRVIVCS